MQNAAKDKINVAIVGPGNIGTDLLYKILNRSKYMNLSLVAGIKQESRGYDIAKENNIASSDRGIYAAIEDETIDIIFDATMAKAHKVHAPLIKKAGKIAIDLTPAAVGPYVCPVVNMEEHLDADNINLITCGGQATIPIVYAISRVCKVEYAEIVACISRQSAGPGTRNSIDEFTITTADGICKVGGAQKAKAIILLNPSMPPIMMNNTVYCLVKECDQEKIENSVNDIVEQLQNYVPGYRLKIGPIFEDNKVTVMTEVEGAGDFLPVYSGNLDIETSAAIEIGERIAKKLIEKRRMQYAGS